MSVEKIEVNEDLIIEAVKLISDVLEEHEIPLAEGACAMHSILKSMADNGFDVRIERRVDA